MLKKVDAKGEKLARFMPNPADWGPGSKGTAHAALGILSLTNPARTQPEPEPNPNRTRTRTESLPSL